MASHLPLDEVPGRIADLVHLNGEDDSELATCIHQLIADIDGESPVLNGDADISPIRLVYSAPPKATEKITTIASMVRRAPRGTDERHHRHDRGRRLDGNDTHGGPALAAVDHPG